MKSHHLLPNVESVIMGPNNEQVNFNLDLIWSQYTYEFPEQTWKVVSNAVSSVCFFLNNFNCFYCKYFKNI